MARRRFMTEEDAKSARDGALAQWPLMLGFLFILISFFIPSSERSVQFVTTGELPGDLDRWRKEHPVPDSEDHRRDFITKTAQCAVHLVQLTGAENIHMHVEHDLAVTLLRGKGEVLIGKETKKISAGDSYFIPMGVEHAFINYGGKANPALLVVVSSPNGYDGDYETVGIWP